MASGLKASSCDPLTLVYPSHFEDAFGVNLESITFMKVKIIVYQQGKSPYIIAKRNV